MLGSAPYDVVLADLQLPDMTGIDILRRTRVTEHPVPFIIMTAFGTVPSSVEAIRLGACDYKEKPLSELDVVEMVSRIATRPPPTARSDVPAHDWRVLETLRIIRVRFAEPDLRLGAIAERFDVSTEHLARLLKQQTRRAFSVHLHQARVSEAMRLLNETTLSVKEIAYRVGYPTTTRLEHHFKSICGRLPTIFRQDGRAKRALDR